MPPVNLTDGAIAMLSTGDGQRSDVQPVLQVVDIRLINSQNQINTDRYRILLSDGTFTQQGMLATQRNDLVRSDKLQKGSIILLVQYVCNLIQNRRIIIIIDLDVIVQKCDIIGEPKSYPALMDGDVSSATSPSAPGQPMNQSAGGNVIRSSYGAGGNVTPPSYGAGVAMGGSAPRPNMGGSAPRSNMGGGIHGPHSVEEPNQGSHSYSSNMDSGRYNSSNVSPIYPKQEASSGVPRAPVSNYARPPQSLYNQTPPMFANRGPIAKNEGAARIIPIAALNPYQGRWTIKARVTAKADLRHYSNARGEGKVFSFDLLDSDGGEIRVTCFNAVADQFYQQIEPGRVYMISKGTLKPAQKAFNHLRNDHEIMLDSTSTIQACFEDDTSIPQQQFHFRPISDIEGLENNSVIDVIAIVTSISPSSSIMRKNGMETQKRTLQLKDMSGRSVELTLWGNFCNAEGQTLQGMCDSGVFPVLAVKSGRVNEFNGKSVGTISTSQLFVEPDFPEAQKLKAWFNTEGKSTPAISLSRESNVVRADVRKTISQIKDEKLGTSEKPDWITVSATLTFVKVDNFCYTACPLMIGERQCSKKVTNNGDGKWRCERCDQVVDECDYRYILQMQIQDHTGLTWVTAFQESGEDIMGIPAKDLYYLKYEEQDDEKFNELMRSALFTKFVFKLKVKEETFSDEQRVKSTVVKAEKLNFQTETRFLLDSIAKFKEEDSAGFLPPKTEQVIPTSGPTSREYAAPATSYSGMNSNASQMNSSYGRNQYGGSGSGSGFNQSGSTGMYMSCSSCGGNGHTSANCPSLMSGPAQSYGTGAGNRATPGGGGATGECYKCHQTGHWARDCPATSNAPPAYGSGNSGASSGGGGASGECFKCHQTGHWARDCPGTSNAQPAYGGTNVNSSRYISKQHVGGF
ncbi:hypothetical protein ABFS82_01G053300 [Erythranthe guttata]|uniref:replication protein A 70 kDa DNA-binding subunit A-like n=1 Tax=Erythranthe guttata TaxID=4155 RepID=UPI00064DC196|nr:PREDICTED: replication protein A 70 kDa DNA-binding subunit A-like [Erythranthe guttata]|eukprot:XP_012837416.1 PREDICTED: replication protein A 70 kDa DNA-binding subunit A-like [Erythranthe guttata]